MIRGLSASMIGAQMRKLMKQTCYIERVTSGNDGSGGIVETRTPLGSCACTLTQSRITDVMALREGRVATRYELTLRVPLDQEIAENDRVTVDGETYRAQNVVEDHQWPLYKRVTLERLK